MKMVIELALNRIELMRGIEGDSIHWELFKNNYIALQTKELIEFHKWMLKNDTAENGEKYFHYTDEDMVNEYLNNKII